MVHVSPLVGWWLRGVAGCGLGVSGAWPSSVPVFDFFTVPEGYAADVCDGLWCSVMGAVLPPCVGFDVDVAGALGAVPEFHTGVRVGEADADFVGGCHGVMPS